MQPHHTAAEVQHSSRLSQLWGSSSAEIIFPGCNVLSILTRRNSWFRFKSPTLFRRPNLIKEQASKTVREAKGSTHTGGKLTAFAGHGFHRPLTAAIWWALSSTPEQGNTAAALPFCRRERSHGRWARHKTKMAEQMVRVSCLLSHQPCSLHGSPHFLLSKLCIRTGWSSWATTLRDHAHRTREAT